MAIRSILFVAALGCLSVGCGSERNTEPGEDTRAPENGSNAAPLLLLEWGASNSLTPVDPATLSRLPGHAPLDMGHWASSIASPDGRLLASIIERSQDVTSGRLHFFDLVRWKELFELPEPKGSVHPFVWSPDGRWFYAMQEEEIWAVDVRSKAARLVADFDFRADSMHVSPNGDTLYLFAFELEDPNTHTVGGDPFLVAFDVASRAEKARVGLPGVLVGQRREEGGPQGHYYVSYHPGRAMFPDGRRYYVAHPAEDRVTVVDLQQMAVVKSEEPARKASFVERVAGFFLGTGLAEAKGGSVKSKQVLVSPDSRRLFITGVHDSDPIIEPTGRQPMGLQVLDAATLEIAAGHEGVGSVVLSGDGALLFATGWSHEYTQTAASEYWPDNHQGIGLKILDAQSLELRAHVEPDSMFQQTIVGGDGQYVYLLSDDLMRMDLGARRGLSSHEPRQRITIVDVPSGRVVHERVADGGYIELIASDGR